MALWTDTIIHFSQKKKKDTINYEAPHISPTTKECRKDETICLCNNNKRDACAWDHKEVRKVG